MLKQDSCWIKPVPATSVQGVLDAVAQRSSRRRRIIAQRIRDVIRYLPELSVVKLKIGDRIGLTESEFEQLSVAFFADLEQKFLWTRRSGMAQLAVTRYRRVRPCCTRIVRSRTI
jgi:hypothetical protein